MSLYGKTDSAANVTKASRGIAASSQAKTIVYVDNQEAALPENKARGINAPGWWSYFTYTDADGHVRHKAEHLVTIAGPDLNSNETQSDDAIAADYTIAIDAQPVDQTVASGDPVTFIVAASTTPSGGDLTYEWFFLEPGGTWETADGAAWATLATSPTLTIPDSSVDLGGGGNDLNGYKFRVVVSNTGASGDVTSEEATLTITV